MATIINKPKGTAEDIYNQLLPAPICAPIQEHNELDQLRSEIATLRAAVAQATINKLNKRKQYGD